MIVNKGMYDKEFKFDNAGKEESILLKPLPVANIPELFKIVAEIQRFTTAGTTDVLSVLSSDADTAKLIVNVVRASVKKSYPEMSDDVLDDFVSMNMFQLLPLVIEVNFRT
jgi:hypothetical protein